MAKMNLGALIGVRPPMAGTPQPVKAPKKAGADRSANLGKFLHPKGKKR